MKDESLPIFICLLSPVWDRDGVKAGGPCVGEHSVGDPDPVHHPPVEVQGTHPQWIAELEPRVMPELTEINVQHKVVIVII